MPVENSQTVRLQDVQLGIRTAIIWIYMYCALMVSIPCCWYVSLPTDHHGIPDTAHLQAL